MNKGFVATDGDFAMNTGHTSTSFEAFLSSISEQEETSQKVDSFDDSYETEDTYDTGDSFIDEFDKLFGDEEGEEFDTEDGTEDSDKHPEDEDSEEDSDEEDGEGEDEEFDYSMEDWNSSIILPNGMEVTAEDLKEYKDFNSKLGEFNTQKQEVMKKEKMLADNTNITMAAINSVKQQLEQTAAYRPLTVLEQAQLQSFSQMESYVNNTVDAFAQTHKHQLDNATRIKQETYSNNIDTCFEMYPELDKDIVDIKEYLSSKKVNANAYLESILMDPTVISILQDAVSAIKVKNKVFSPAKKIAKPIKGNHKVAPTPVDNTSVPYGISSHDVGSYKAFASLGIK